MAKIYSLHEIELRPGVTPEEFERFLTQEYIAGELPPPPGWKVSYLKANRGGRDGKYAVLIEVDSVEERDRLFPKPGEMSPEAQQHMAKISDAQRALDERYAALATSTGESYTDYAVLGD
jgi:hypothetical protein